MGRKIDKNDIQPGDLVFWYRGKGYIGHVGMVVSVDSAHNFKFIHSATHGKGVRYDYSTSNWYTSTYAGARRIIECDSQVVVTPNQPPAHAKSEHKIIYHKIKSGETLTSIAKKYHVTVNQIKQWNRLKSDMIRAGEKLKIIRK